LKDVWTLLPNQIDYARLLMGTAPVYLPHQFYMLSAGLYFTSHLLDQVDGKVARMLNQKSHFGVVLGYSVDIITGAVFMLKMCSLAAAPAYYIVPCSVVIAVETFGLVLAVNASAAGKYWKITDPKTPYVLRKIVMKDGKYTPLGHFSVVAHQAMVTCAWLMVFDPSGIWLGAMAALSPFASLNLWANSAIVYEMLRTWEEPAP
jgi:phosphatidylglycerophosphate synthase